MKMTVGEFASLSAQTPGTFADTLGSHATTVEDPENLPDGEVDAELDHEIIELSNGIVNLDTGQVSLITKSGAVEVFRKEPKFARKSKWVPYTDANGDSAWRNTVTGSLKYTKSRPVEKDSSEWVPYEGPDGGTGWSNGERVVYDDEPPGDIDTDALSDEQIETLRAETDLLDKPAVEEMDDAGYVSNAETPDLRVSTADEEVDLHAEGVRPGASSRHMSVAKWDDGREAFVTRYGSNQRRDRSGEDPILGERAIAADAFMRHAGHDESVPAHHMNREGDDESDSYLAVEGVDGEMVSTASDDRIDRVDVEQAKEKLATVLVAGNSDMHGDNVLIGEDGTLKFVDLDKSGGRFTESNRFRRRGVRMLLATADTLGIDMDRSDLEQAAQNVAEELEIDTVEDVVPDSEISEKIRHQYSENIAANIEAFREGGVL